MICFPPGSFELMTVPRVCRVCEQNCKRIKSNCSRLEDDDQMESITGNQGAFKKHPRRRRSSEDVLLKNEFAPFYLYRVYLALLNLPDAGKFLLR